MENRYPISADDWQQSAELLADVAAAETLHEMTAITTRRAHDLFSAELAICDRFDAQGRQLAFQMYPPATSDLQRRIVPVFFAEWREHPYQPRLLEEIGGGLVGFLSDRISTREFQRTTLWNQVYIHLRARNQMLVGGPVKNDLYWCLSLNRLGRDFTSRDRDLGRFLQPRLSRLFERQTRLERGSRMAQILGTASPATLVVDRSGRIVESSAKARSMLNGTPDGRLIAELVPNPAAPATCIANLSIDGIPAVAYRPERQGPAFVMLDTERRQVANRMWNLTPRESEVLHWLAEGKTNPEIAVLLGISPRTVAKHCELLFAKLGVENRFGAATWARRFA